MRSNRFMRAGRAYHTLVTFCATSRLCVQDGLSRQSRATGRSWESCLAITVGTFLFPWALGSSEN